VSAGQAARTVLDALVGALEKAVTDASEVGGRPAVVLWTDKERQWEPIVQLLKLRLPAFLVLGPWAPAERSGPAIWLRCVLAGAIPEVIVSADAASIVYLPGISRAELRAVEDCSRLLQPLAELQYRGTFFSQKNGKDWTVRAFLEAEGGLGLDVAGDEATSRALLASAGELAGCPVRRLSGKRLEAIDFNELVAPDMVRSLLGWMNDPKGTKATWPAERWKAFVSECKTSLHFDPRSEGELAAAELLGGREHGWETVWQRFEEAPDHFPGVVLLLEKAEPLKAAGSLYYRAESWPGATVRAEDALRAELLALADAPAKAAAKKIAELEAKNVARRSWLWARLGGAPLARALEHLARVAGASASPIAAASASELAEAWASEGWKVDSAALQALASVERPADVKAVHGSLRAVYLPWLEAVAVRLQGVAGASPPESEFLAAPETGTCVLFADGLRLDVGRRLEEHLKSVGFSVDLAWRWAALPTVTATAKPAVSPVARRFAAGPVADFQTAIDGKPTTTDRFRKLLEAEGITPLGGDATGDPSAKAWTEAGSLDRYGHDQQWKLARRIAEEVKELGARIGALLDAGWREVRVVTDHGWLLVPGGLPTVQLPNYLAESRWGRCASLKEGAMPDLVRVPWRWDPSVWIALAPGVRTFVKGMDYAHGGLSLQECVVPVLTVRAPSAVTSAGKIVSVKWTGLRCKVAVEGATAGSHVDLRQKVADPASTALVEGRVKTVSGDAEVTLFADDKHEGEAVSVVLVRADGQVVAKLPTSVGGGAS
jgi:hypothetical protein